MGCCQSTTGEQLRNNNCQESITKEQSINSQEEISHKSETDHQHSPAMTKNNADVYMPKLPSALRIPAIRIDYRKLKANMEQEAIFRKAAARIGHLIDSINSSKSNSSKILSTTNDSQKIDRSKSDSSI
ncbi:hypothetical protein HUG17_2081 [Dermatophagoides farinae]|uniref:Uncharacterized protein n=1 Tax=Dermatophagoides farinae TaxID=6954 RepID=A0A9D4P9Z3_DERFA|nr:hypothetical protein HUG17_2081 [Dermatophagoides farinae]